MRRVRDADHAVIDGIRVVSTALTSGTLKIHASCEGLLSEMSTYAWDTKAQERGEDKPLKVNDHGPDALRYLAMRVLNRPGASRGGKASGALVLHDLSFLGRNTLAPSPKWSGWSAAARTSSFTSGITMRSTATGGATLWRQDIHASLEMVVGFPQTLSNHWGDLLVGEPPAYSVAGNKEGEDGRRRR